MSESRARKQMLGELLDYVLPADEYERLAHVDALLRVAAARDRNDAIATKAGASGKSRTTAWSAHRTKRKWWMHDS